MPATAPHSPPRVAVVMGVSGSGKSTVAALVAERLGWVFADGDAFHTPGNIARMQAGLPLEDADRAPWLAALAAWIDARLRDGESGVLVCSALKRAYREVLTRGRPAVRIVYLEGDRTLIAGRLAGRQGHFMPGALLDSQFAILEPPGPAERALVVGIEAPPDTLADRIAASLSASEP
ncbi:gluconokinase [Methylobacterium iners]|uniref:Gluconokinase n=1 Tax=Methylobacterium iners TaxID=418707 RepID=A0ABQ4S4Y1_9HYPH|nr:gluconokinase [Methylobacterium iners]GJD97217.1 Gluconokinase [Methylobacterium iners]